MTHLFTDVKCLNYSVTIASIVSNTKMKFNTTCGTRRDSLAIPKGSSLTVFTSVGVEFVPEKVKERERDVCEICCTCTQREEEWVNELRHVYIHRENNLSCR